MPVPPPSPPKRKWRGKRRSACCTDADCMGTGTPYRDIWKVESILSHTVSLFYPVHFSASHLRMPSSSRSRSVFSTLPYIRPISSYDRYPDPDSWTLCARLDSRYTACRTPISLRAQEYAHSKFYCLAFEGRIYFAAG